MDQVGIPQPAFDELPLVAIIGKRQNYRMLLGNFAKKHHGFFLARFTDDLLMTNPGSPLSEYPHLGFALGHFFAFSPISTSRRMASEREMSWATAQDYGRSIALAS